jgi:hypothetical protein
VDLPAYRHVPGLTPHPITDPLGHLYGKGEWLSMPERLSLPADWRRCDPYLFGVDLFNRRYLWEAHEAWEVVWNAVGHESPPGVFVQGLIQAAAALLQAHRCVIGGALTLAAKADAKLARTEPLAVRGRYMGVSVESWRRAMNEAVRGTGPFPLLRVPAPDAPAGPSDGAP